MANYSYGFPSRSSIEKIRNTDFSAIDHVMKNAPQFSSVAQLGAFIKQNAPSELYRIRAAYYWMGTNINYDKTYSRYHADETFQTRSGVCQGFSELFVEVAGQVGLKAQLITGYAKGSGYRPGGPLDSNHAWNLVQHQGEWYPMDVTWSSCLSDYQHYFMTDPEEMIFTHLPVDSQWNGHDFDYTLNRGNQLMTSIVEYNEWQRLPDLYPESYYQHPGAFRISSYRINKPAIEEPDLIVSSRNIGNETVNYNPSPPVISSRDFSAPPDNNADIDWEQVQKNIKKMWQEIASEENIHQLQKGLQEIKQMIKDWVADW
ncbi:MAG: transglutaminase domain-containing protein [Cyclobacteriaceae bacterium]